ncbi:membrane protein insertion efficiency factor YidD [Massilia sp. PWRC2]|uniref:membrane protein insertion efficiency factor YidD n=1 Tax=Massilia sp. PWRC2 TaxID=2804626 RepID=UPI003CEBEBF6
MKSLALYAIRLYQRYLSPYKGFSCAYAAVCGHASCSALGYRAIRRFGLWRGVGVLDQRLYRCGVAYRRLQRVTLAVPRSRQAGIIDCGGCDVPSSCDLPCHGPHGCHLPHLFDGCDLSSCGGDCNWRRRQPPVDQDQQQAEEAALPVRSRRAGP